jgi:hypothetical protein
MKKAERIWIARDCEGLHAFIEQPITTEVPLEGDLLWRYKNGAIADFDLDFRMFPEVTFDNSPVKARIILED